MPTIYFFTFYGNTKFIVGFPDGYEVRGTAAPGITVEVQDRYGAKQSDQTVGALGMTHFLVPAGKVSFNAGGYSGSTTVKDITFVAVDLNKGVTHIYPSVEGEASVGINLPSELKPGDWIIGDFTLKNIGEAKDRLRIFIDPTWLPVNHTLDIDLKVGQTFRVKYIEGSHRMPDSDAGHIVKGYHLENGEWILDDTKTH